MKHKKFINLCEEHEVSWYDDKHDAYYCPDCRKWLEKKCKDKECEYCVDRPKKSPGKAILRFNNGGGAILCSKCNIIVKEGFDNFTSLETEAFTGMIYGLREYFCEECKENAN